MKDTQACDECGADISTADSVQVAVYFYPEGLDVSQGPTSWQYATLCAKCYTQAAEAYPTVFGVRKHNQPLTPTDPPITNDATEAR